MLKVPERLLQDRQACEHQRVTAEEPRGILGLSLRDLSLSDLCSLRDSLSSSTTRIWKLDEAPAPRAPLSGAWHTDRDAAPTRCSCPQHLDHLSLINIVPLENPRKA